MHQENYREIPYNFTSADDKLIIELLFGPAVWEDLEELRSQRITGRSARLVMRFMGDLFILRRNPFLYQELLDSLPRREQFFKTAEEDLHIIETAAGIARVGASRSSRVLHLVTLCRERLGELKQELVEGNRQRNTIRTTLGTIIGRDNVCFDPFALISHATDATDWRLYLPVAVLRPTREEQLPALLQAIAGLNLKAIPRGGGTGLTGGSVPLSKGCVVINTEKLTAIDPVGSRPLSQLDPSTEVPVLRVEAGVITSEAMAAASARGLVFATDPTSAWASTIGGNIAENAGGKTAVLWGTAIDNILSYRIAMPGRGLLTVHRLNHPRRKILPDDQVCFEVVDDQQRLVKEIRLAGTEIRKKGLWKDITNKALRGLPGLQKEGTDGVITSAEFILYPAYPKKITFCLEFFGEDMEEASRVIVDISREFVNQGEEALMALEHFDEEYIKAIQYKFKAARSEHPKAVLLIDMVGHSSEQILRGKGRLEQLLRPYPNTELFTAQDADEATRFWRDRKRLGAIAARTNAFKLNEDIVLPLSALADFARFAGERNIDEDRYNQEQLIEAITSYLATAEPIEDPDWLEAKIPKANELCRTALAEITGQGHDRRQQNSTIVRLMANLLELFSGYHRVSANLERIHQEVRARRIVIATHMHAGDGNIHVNIPVFSNDRAMMLRAEQTAEAVMTKAVELGGVVSGEHGIGITKMKFLDRTRFEELKAYRREVDPQGVMNPGMLSDPEIINKVFTPSFNLLQLEAKILQYGSLARLSEMIAKCIRCGKCMPLCCVHHPGSDLFFSPRNKNMVIASLIEAMLYDVQRSHQPRFTQLRNLEEIADHCTMCRKCLAPCPVDIDTAEVSILERELLSDLGYKHTAPLTRLTLFYLKNRNRTVNTIFRKTVVQGGGTLQRLAHLAYSKVPQAVKESHFKPFELLQSSMPSVAAEPLAALLPRCSDHEALLFTPEETIERTVFYFPGCGSERLYTDIAMAALSLLVNNRIRVILPPPGICCGFPARVNAKKKMAAEIALRNTIILSQIREMLGHLVFDAFLVSCGTCRESLEEIGCPEIFECQIEDISSYILERTGAAFGPKRSARVLYHRPCHDSCNGNGETLLRRLYQDVVPVANCCSEAGTLAVSRPDISQAMLSRKRQATTAAEPAPGTIYATNCPSCLTGLGRNRQLGVVPRHLAVLLAEAEGGSAWQEGFAAIAARAEKVTF